MNNFNEYQEQIKHEFNGCTFDNCQPLTKFQFKQIQVKAKQKKERLKKVEYCLRVTDDSMSHTSPDGHFFPKGSKLYIAPPNAEPIKPGCYVIATIKGRTDHIFRRLQHSGEKLILTALNPNYPDIEHEFSIIGKVVDVDVSLYNKD